MGRVAVVFNVLSCRGVGQPVLELSIDLLHNGSHDFALLVFGRILQGGENGRGQLAGWGAAGESDEVGRGLEGDGGVCFAAQYTLDGSGGVEASGYAATEGLDACDGVGGGSRDNDMYGCGKLLWILQRQLAHGTLSSN